MDALLRVVQKLILLHGVVKSAFALRRVKKSPLHLRNVELTLDGVNYSPSSMIKALGETGHTRQEDARQEDARQEDARQAVGQKQGRRRCQARRDKERVEALCTNQHQ